LFSPRPAQAQVLRYRQGRMGVSAVPGSGKTQTLSQLAALLIAEEAIREDQEVLIVTLVNSAVDNFTSRIQSMIQPLGLLPGMGYRVRTLHGLAYDIVRERPDLVSLSDHFQIIDEAEAEDILERVCNTWLRSHYDFMDTFSLPDRDPYQDRKLMTGWQGLVVSTASAFIRQAKDLQASPNQISEQMHKLRVLHPLLIMGSEIYTDYQRALNYRGVLDFDDLIRLGLLALESDPEFLERLRYRWPYILEDEAQDSSRLQEEILRLLSGPQGNWVRVGDPNQAIYETFTTASPEYLLRFRTERGVIVRDLPNSGRSTPSIIHLANHLIEWVRENHPNELLRSALNLPWILPTEPGDPQPNPEDQPEGIHLPNTKYTPDKEIDNVVRSLKRWLPEHSDSTVAALVPRNERGIKLVEALKKHDIPYVEILRTTDTTRQTISLLGTILHYLAEPASSRRLSQVYLALHQRDGKNVTDGYQDIINTVDSLISKNQLPEDYLWPLPGRDWLGRLSIEDNLPPQVIEELKILRDTILRWQSATLLPIDQLLLTISQDLFTLPHELALAHKLALSLERAAQANPEWHLQEFSQELDDILKNRRKYTGFSDEDTGFDPQRYKGKVVVATIHKAKGLEWDRVYLLSVNNYDFPSADSYDRFFSERWFVRDSLNLEAETLARLKALMSNDIPGVYMEEGPATQQARIDYASERLRLLYVGITRACKELVITWNNGQNSDCLPARALIELRSFWEKRIQGEHHGME